MTSLRYPTSRPPRRYILSSRVITVHFVVVVIVSVHAGTDSMISSCTYNIIYGKKYLLYCYYISCPTTRPRRRLRDFRKIFDSASGFIASAVTGVPDIFNKKKPVVIYLLYRYVAIYIILSPLVGADIDVIV